MYRYLVWSGHHEIEKQTFLHTDTPRPTTNAHDTLRVNDECTRTEEHVHAESVRAVLTLFLKP